MRARLLDWSEIVISVICELFLRGFIGKFSSSILKLSTVLVQCLHTPKLHFTSMEIAIQGKAFLSSLSHFPLSNPKGVLLKFRPAPQSLPLLSSKSKSPFLRICTHGGGRPRIVACSNDNNLDGGSMSSSKEASFDLKLPRRNLIVQFTCNACGERTERTVNKVAYQRGTVFVQCAGCLVHHKLVDNLGLVVEYDLRNELDADYDGARLE